jgi:hypothetical protein
LYNQAERIFQAENNKPTNKKIKQELDQNKITFVVTFVALGSLGCDKLV